MHNMDYQYKVWIKLQPNNTRAWLMLPKHTIAVCDVLNGFWINKHGQFTRGSDSVNYVPASQILSIQKVYDNE